MEPSIKTYIQALVEQMSPKVNLLDLEHQNTLIRAVWMHYGTNIKASSILRAAQKLRTS